MKKAIQFILVGVVLTLASFAQNVPSPLPPQNLLQEQVDLFDGKYTINQDGTVDVTETIHYRFSSSRHGIVRTIPFIKTNQDGKKYRMDIKVTSVTDTSSVSYQYSSTYNDTSLVLKIGDPDKLVSGKKTYIINYTVSGALTYFTDHDEFYWNITGTDSEVPTKSYSADVMLPPGSEVDTDKLTINCFTGTSGSKEKNCRAGVIQSGALVRTGAPLGPKQVATFAFTFPKGIASVLEPVEDKPSLLYTIIVTLLGIGAFLWFFVLPIKIIVTYLADRSNTKQKQRIVSAWFEAPSDKNGNTLRPAEVSSLVSKNISNKEITATIIDLAFRGYIKIKQVESTVLFIKRKDIELVKLKPFDGLNSYEKELTDILFGGNDSIKISDLKDNTRVFNGINSVKTKILKNLQVMGMFSQNPKTTLDIYLAVTAIALFTANFVLAAIAWFMGRKSAKRTDLGIEKYSEAVSLKNFLVSQDEKLDFQADKQMFFEKLLPYATAFGVESVWIKKFEGLNLQNPNWYDGDMRNLYALSAITNSINSGVGAMSTTRSSSGFSSGSGGGGFSGGGGGGGSVGSW